jgi:hypothetical protein
MESFYTIIYYKTNPLSDEMIALGIFCGGGEGPFVYLSDSRLRLVKNVIHNNSFLALSRNLLSFEKSVNQYRNSSNDLMLFDPTYAIELFDQLSKKSKGALLYSSPTVVNGWMTTALFNELTVSFLGESSLIKKRRKLKPFHVKWKSIKKAKRFKNLERDTLISEIIPNVSLEFTIDLFDKNKMIAYKALDFDSSQKTFTLKIKDVNYLLKNNSLNLVLVSPKPKTKLGKERIEDLVAEYGHLEVVTADELMKLYA